MTDKPLSYMVYLWLYLGSIWMNGVALRSRMLQKSCLPSTEKSLSKSSKKNKLHKSRNELKFLLHLYKQTAFHLLSGSGSMPFIYLWQLKIDTPVSWSVYFMVKLTWVRSIIVATEPHFSALQIEPRVTDHIQLWATVHQTQTSGWEQFQNHFTFK